MGTVWSLPLPVHRQTHTHDTHAHAQTYIHTCTCIGDTRTHSHNTVCTHSDMHITQTYMQDTHTHTLGQIRHTHVHPYTQKGTHAQTRVHRQTQMHTCHTQTHTHAQTPARGHDDAICTWVESSGLRKAAEWGLGKRDLCVSVGGVTQHLRAGTREERQRWGKRWVWEEGRQLRLCGQQRSFQRVSEASWVHTGVLTRQQEDRLRLRGVRGLQ